MNKTLLSFSRVILLSALTPLSLVVGCSSDESPPAPPAGCTGAACANAGTSGASGSGGTAGTGGSAGTTAGQAGQGGSAAGAAGDGGTGGTSAEGGSAGAGATAGTGGTGSSGGTAGTGGSGGTGGTATPECTQDSDCLGTLDPECAKATCVQGQCALQLMPSNTLITDPNAGDCHIDICDGQGARKSIASLSDPPVQIASDCQKLECGPNGDLVTVIDDTDTQDDQNPCTLDICNGNTPSHNPSPPGTECGNNGICTGTGICGVCIPDTQECSAGMPRACSAQGAWEDVPEHCSNLGCISDSECNVPLKVTAGDTFSCVLLSNGTVRCWGDNSKGQLGQGDSVINSSTPLTVAFPETSPAIDLQSGANHTCARLQSGAVYCWGANDLGQTGTNTNATVVATPSKTLENQLRLFVGRNDSCALDMSPVEKCWGDNSKKQLSMNSLLAKINPPAVASNVDGFQAIAPSFGPLAACVVRGTAVECWGGNTNFIVQPSNSAGVFGSHTAQGGITNASKVAVGTSHATRYPMAER
ncbi:MAG: hypothetical protein U0165_15985 [Polyangiaceae bacterium]